MATTRTATGGRPRQEDNAPQAAPDSWVAWLFGAWLRDTPLPFKTLDAAAVKNARDTAVSDWLDGQILYHVQRRTQMHLAGKRLLALGESLFAGLVVLAIARFALDYWGNGSALHDTLSIPGIAGAILGAGSAALAGIRIYADMAVGADQSQAMLISLRRVRGQIAELDPASKLASQVIGSALAGVATLMLEDLEGWKNLSRA